MEEWEGWGEQGPSALSQALGLLGHALLPSCRKIPCSQKDCVCVCVMGVWGVSCVVYVRIAVSEILKLFWIPDASGSINDWMK